MVCNVKHTLWKNDNIDDHNPPEKIIVFIGNDAELNALSNEDKTRF